MSKRMDLYLYLALAITGLTTYVMKAWLFVFFSGKKSAPILLYLGRVLGSAVVSMLIIYGLKDSPLNSAPYGLNELVALLSVVGLHLYLRIFVLSIVGGTGVYMYLVQSAIKLR
ncbi:hypothetical protein HSHS1_14700 [Helicobacter suis HS1]|nr:hypothetical protein HSHS1_14700 [Helicobacter suis HS1]